MFTSVGVYLSPFTECDKKMPIFHLQSLLTKTCGMGGVGIRNWTFSNIALVCGAVVVTTTSTKHLYDEGNVRVLSPKMDQ